MKTWCARLVRALAARRERRQDDLADLAYRGGRAGGLARAAAIVECAAATAQSEDPRVVAAVRGFAAAVSMSLRLEAGTDLRDRVGR